MNYLIAKCGFNCSQCAAYRDNVKTQEDRQRGSDGWKKYLGFRINPENMYCDGCPTPIEENRSSFLFYIRRCPIRKCTVENKAETCAHCSGYYKCMYELKIITGVSREKIEEKLGTKIPEEDYHSFIEPFEHLKHLEKIRASLSPDDIVEPKYSSIKPRIASFPEDLPLSKDEVAAFRKLHNVLKSIISLSGDTHARRVVFKKRKNWMLKFLWTIGLLGKLGEKNTSYLVMGSETYQAQKTTSNWSTVSFYFKLFEKYGVRCVFVHLVEDYLLPSGWLRKMRACEKVAPWFMKMSFDNSAGGEAALKALRKYATTLNKKHGRNAYRYFAKADMRIFGDVPKFHNE